MRHARIDSNQPAIVGAFRALGFTVQHLHTVGAGCPDIAVGRNGATHLVEIKDGSLEPARRKLTPKEKEFFTNWRGSAFVVESVADVQTLAKNLP